MLDLFSGCGGISLGFERAGFRISAAVEVDAEAAATHAAAFHGDAPAFAEHERARDITSTQPSDLIADLELGVRMTDAIDVIVGGPPCQSFARIGRAKLREVRDHPKAFIHDPRASLYEHYLAYVAALQPAALLIENVPDSINHGGQNIPAGICDALAEFGYDAKYTILNAAHFGVPQMRDRMFLLAYHRLLDTSPAFPEPTHHVDLPRGYHGTRSVALKHVRATLFEQNSFFIEPVEPGEDLPPAVSAHDALADLPRITKHLAGGLKKGPALFDEHLTYRTPPESDFARMMRNWPGHSSPGYVRDHVIRYLPRDYGIFRRMQPGDQYPQAHGVALEMFQEALARAASGGRPVREETQAWRDLRASIVPPYDPGKFPNKWRKMEPDLPARTLMAHIGKDSYSHIHYDSSQARTISVREAARLQSFPDGFFFVGRMNSALRQIGNAVPPLLSYAVADRVRAALFTCADTHLAAAA